MKQLVMNTMPELALCLPVGSLEAYIQSVNGIPVLSAGEERELAERYQQRNDLDAARRLVLAHLRFVVRIARGYAGYGLPQADLIQEGSIGLMKAVKRYDPGVGVRLVTFAVHWIRAEIHEYILRNWRIVKVATTKAQRKLFFNLRKATKCLGWMSKDEAEDVAKELGVDKKTVLDMEQRLNAHDTSFDWTPGEDAEESPKPAPVHTHPDPSYGPAELVETEQTEQRSRHELRDALSALDERGRAIVTQRWLQEEKATLHDLAAQFGVSAERIRQLEKRALEQLREHLEAVALLPSPAR
ncbi:MAG: RNA polymerase sigma factor RpoH [Gammaproteobacteria bacterium]